MQKMKEIKLTRGYKCLVDDEDYPVLKKFMWCACVEKGRKRVYAKKSFRNGDKTTSIPMHVFLMNPPKGYHVHHKDGNTLNNQKSNLEIKTPHNHISDHNSDFIECNICGEKVKFFELGSLCHMQKDRYLICNSCSQKAIDFLKSQAA